VVQFSIMSNHLHLIVEAKDRESLSRGMQGLLVRIARGLNRLWRRVGSVFSDRYHDVILRTPRQVRNALIYVLRNAFKHRMRLEQELDMFSSGPWFDGWKESFTVTNLPNCPVAEPRTWLLRTGWHEKHGRIGMTERPASWPGIPA
jgi:REP element-mobilizing transposase RayT